MVKSFVNYVKGRAFGSPLARGLKPRASTAAFSTPGKPGASAAVKRPTLTAFHGDDTFDSLKANGIQSLWGKKNDENPIQ
jgi:hypothetical protein